MLLQPAQKPSAETNQRIEALEEEVDKIESQLAQHVAGLGQARHALGVSLEQVQATIPNDDALIEYLRYPRYLGKEKWEQRYGAIVLLSKGVPLWIPLGKAKEIEHLVRRYGTLVRGSPQEEELSANLQALYEALWAPIGQALPSQTKRAIVSPDGQLNFISFATLLTKDNQFLAQRYSVQYVASGRDLLRQVKPIPPLEKLFYLLIRILVSLQHRCWPRQSTVPAMQARSVGAKKGMSKIGASKAWMARRKKVMN